MSPSGLIAWQVNCDLFYLMSLSRFLAPRALPLLGYGGVIDSSVLVLRTRESILTFFLAKFRSIYTGKRGPVSSERIGITFMELNFVKGFFHFSYIYIYFFDFVFILGVGSLL